MGIRRLIYIMFILSVMSLQVQARRSEILSDRIHTLQVSRNGDWQELPVITLRTDDFIQISFDEFTHQYNRLTYHIRHCNADWKESSLSEIDYLDGFNDRTLDDFEYSRNTTFLYTHYVLKFPNENTRLTKSGNYEVTVTDDDSHEKLLIARFSIQENCVGINASVTGDTDASINDKYQQLSIKVGFGQLPVLFPASEVFVHVTQNNSDATEVSGIGPSFFSQRELEFTHHPKLIFKGGNEFRRFEIIDMYSYMQHVDRIDFYDPYFHATLMQDLPTKQYRYDEDHNGRYLVRKHEAVFSEIEADYLFVHFSLKMPEMSGGKLYLDGDFADAGNRYKWAMEYNARTGCYEKAVLLKMGSYDYRYLWMPDGTDRMETGATEGDSYETVNDYQIYVWFRQQGSRYDRLVGVDNVRMR